MLYASNYRGKIPLELYIELQNKFPQLDNEPDAAWMRRVKREPDLYRRMFGTPEFRTELIQAVHRRAMAMAGARRTGQRQAGPGLVRLTQPGDKQAVTTIAQRYREEFMVANESQFKYATAAYDWLMEEFDANTPIGGSIFWNGINELALAKLVDKWNSELGGELFGQLEATTSARYVNKKFEWDQGGVFQKFFTEASDRLGHAARGHVTSVVRCGLRHDSIFTTTELPRMLGSMDQQISAKQSPTITDITIVVIEPKHLPDRPIATFTNNEITMIPIVKPIQWRINGRNDCTVQGHVDVPLRVREYWSKQGTKQESSVAARIRQDFGSLIRWP